MYIASLNHGIWLHATPASDRWLHVATRSVNARDGRGFSVGLFHDEAGQHVATATQDCLVAYLD
jgi:acyl-CoA thioesterase-2